MVTRCDKERILPSSQETGRDRKSQEEPRRIGEGEEEEEREEEEEGEEEKQEGTGENESELVN